ncbi:MAG: histidine kinase [Vulcanimicrobiaceae bacterium]|jgi:signal transduction histidine kinase
MGEADLALLGALAETLAAPGELGDALERVLALLIERFGMVTGWVWLVDPHTTRFYHAASVALPAYLREPVRMTGAACWCIEAFLAGDFDTDNVEVVNCSRLRDAYASGAAEQAEGVRFHASVALALGGKRLGLINIAGRDRPRLHADELRVLEIVGAHVALAVDRARLAEENVTSARARERLRLARELHDTLAQDLVAIGLQGERALGVLPDAPKARGALERIVAVARDGLDRARQSVLALRTLPAETTLAEALASLAHEVSSRTGLRIRTAIEPALRLDERCETELIRIAGEALSNVERHAQATRVEVTLARRDGAVELVVADDGIGLPSQRREGFGIAGMDERAREAGGTFALESDGNGTRVRVCIPAS